MAVRKLHGGLLLALGVVLGGASLVAAFRLQTHASPMGHAGSSIGKVSFEPSPEDVPEARAGKLVLVTARQGSFGEAYMAVKAALEAYCPDGRGHSVWDTEPGGEIGADEWDQPSQPAGTRHSQSFRCDGPLPNEFKIAADTPETTAEAAVQRVLAELGAGASDQSSVMTVPYYQQQPKYHAFDRALGSQLRRFTSSHCPDGQVVMDAVVVGVYPPADPAKAGSIRHTRMMLGMALSCRVPDAADA